MGTHDNLTVVNSPSHPQALFFSAKPEMSATFAAMEPLVSRALRLDREEYSTIRISEWDIAVSIGESYFDGVANQHMLSMGCNVIGKVETPVGETGKLEYAGKQPSATLQVNDDLPVPLRRLIRRELVPWLLAQEYRPYLQYVVNRSGGSMSPGAPAMRPVTATRVRIDPGNIPGFVPFVLDADGHAIAGDFTQDSAHSTRCWILPFVPERPELWLAAAISDWHAKTPLRVPLASGWRSRYMWMTTEERELAEALEGKRQERERINTNLNSEEADLESRLQEAVVRADKGIRYLLTEQGDLLKGAVIRALDGLGFDVVDVDAIETGDASKAKVEDLRIKDPQEPSWRNITEVRGYNSGAKTADLQRISRFETLYFEEFGFRPQSLWYIVNQFMNDDPDQRQPPLTGTPEDVRVFAEAGGLVVDTRELYRLAGRVADGTVDAKVARDALKSQRGIFQAV